MALGWLGSILGPSSELFIGSRLAEDCLGRRARRCCWDRLSSSQPAVSQPPCSWGGVAAGTLVVPPPSSIKHAVCLLLKFV